MWALRRGFRHAVHFALSGLNGNNFCFQTPLKTVDCWDGSAPFLAILASGVGDFCCMFLCRQRPPPGTKAVFVVAV